MSHSKKQSKSDPTALDYVQEGIKGLQRIEKLIQDAKVAANPVARKRGMPDAAALLRITEAILRANFDILTPLTEWAKAEDFWVRFERKKARRVKAKLKRK